MPPLGRRTMSEEAIVVIREWIAAMSFSEQDAERLIMKQKENFQKYMDEGIFSSEEID